MVGLGAIGGALTALVSEGFNVFKAAGDRKHELKLLNMHIAVGKQETEREIAVTTIEAQTEALVSSRKHDMAITNTSLWVANLRASLRPIVTYMVIVIAFTLFFASEHMPELNTIQKSIVASFLMLMEAVTAFWFTGRIVGKK